MNIFFLDTDIKKSAEYHVDKHVVKMRLELAQIACTIHHIVSINKSNIPYKPTHRNHPSTVWARESIDNYNYVVDLGMALCDELRFRFDTPFQRCHEVFAWLKLNQPDLPDIGFTKPKLAINWNLLSVNEIPQDNEESDLDWAVKNYRAYYNDGKQHLYAWKRRTKPEWIK